MNKHQAVTRGNKTLGAKWLFELLFSHQTLLYPDSEATPKSPTFHTATVSTHKMKQAITILIILILFSCQKKRDKMSLDEFNELDSL
jgi:hypothetical protein